MSEPLGGDQLLGAAEQALTAGDAALVIAFHTWGGLTRYASSQIHQNTWREDVEIRIAAVADSNRVGVASVHSLEPGDVRRTADDALAIARVTPPDPDFPGLAEPAAYATKKASDPATAQASPADRADAVARALAVFPAGVEGAGFVETSATEVAVASSAGVRAYAQIGGASMSVMALGETSSGFAEVAEHRLADLEPEVLAERAVRKEELGRDPEPIEPGAYTVVLEPAAAATLMQFLGWIGFGAKAFLEGRSFLAGRIGEHIVSELVTIADDPLADDSFGLPFDFEGTPARPVTIIDRGIASDVVWDRGTAAQAGRDSTGHALPPPTSEGPFPLNLRMSPGPTALEEMIEQTEHGLLVSRFHYSNIVNEKEAVLTGMTRDGTFLIVDGRLKHGVRNMRYTQNGLTALAEVEAVGDRTEIATELFFGGARAPALKIARFNFSSSTSY